MPQWECFIWPRSVHHLLPCSCGFFPRPLASLHPTLARVIRWMDYIPCPSEVGEGAVTALFVAVWRRHTCPQTIFLGLSLILGHHPMCEWP